MHDRRIGVLMGGMSAEREVSLCSGEAVCRALSARGHAVVPIFVDRDIDQVLRQEPIDVAFIALHGTYGEDGCIQGMLEILGIPYTGPGVAESALCMDKVRAKQLMGLSNVRTPPFYPVAEADLDRLAQVHGGFGFPVFVKPRRQGSSLGAGKAENLEQLRAACEAALRYDSAAVVERFIPGRELTVGVVDGKALGTVEIEPLGGTYDYRTKYGKNMSRYHLPPRLPAERIDAVQRMAERAVAAMGTPGAVRVDVLVTEGGIEYVLEVNTLPGMTETSLLPKIALAAGYDFGALCELILERATLCTEAHPGMERNAALPAAGTHVDEGFATVPGYLPAPAH